MLIKIKIKFNKMDRLHYNNKKLSFAENFCLSEQT
jgi:hypothetical protein